MDRTKQLQTISLCTGYGGIERGLEIAGETIKPVCYVEREGYVLANLLKEIEGGRLAPAPIHTDVKTFPSTYFHNKVDLLTGGYPCQPFSTAGKGRGKDDPRHLWPYILDHIHAIRPSRVFFENVEGHINNGLEEVLDSLEAEGYRTTWGIFSANEVGASHRRKRVFILGDSQHNGSSGSTERRRGGSSSIGSKKRKTTPRELARAGGQENVCDLHSGEWQRLNGKLAAKNACNVESRVPRTTYGSHNRIDRIRLLGNGVVPRQAGWAWLVLNDRLENMQENG